MWSGTELTDTGVQLRGEKYHSHTNNVTYVQFTISFQPSQKLT